MENETANVDPFESLLSTIHESWHPLFKEQKEKLIHISNELSREKKELYPNPDKVFRVFNTDINDIKVVILGQDPYHTPKVANGLAFSVNVANYVPPSLRNIVNSIEESYGESFRITEAKSKKDYRKVWGQHQVEEGVLLLNTALTVRRGEPNSHSNIWLLFISEVIKYLDKNNANLVWMLWGNFAIKMVTTLAPGCKNIACSHPSPLSFKKPVGDFPSFYEAKPFTLCNELLLSLNKTPVEW